MEDASPSPKWRRRKEERPAEIIAAAYAVFTDKGFAAARLDDIAARAGVSKGALYLYFETKQEIFEAVVRSAIAPNIGMIRAFAEAYDGPLEPLLRQIVSRVQAAIGFHFGPVIRMVIGEGRIFPEIARIWNDQMVEPGLSMLTGIIERAQARGEVRPGDPRAFCVSLISPVVAAVIIRETFVPVGAKPFDIGALMHQHLDTVLPGMLTAKAA